MRRLQPGSSGLGSVPIRVHSSRSGRTDVGPVQRASVNDQHGVVLHGDIGVHARDHVVRVLQRDRRGGAVRHRGVLVRLPAEDVAAVQDDDRPVLRGQHAQWRLRRHRRTSGRHRGTGRRHHHRGGPAGTASAALARPGGPGRAPRRASRSAPAWSAGGPHPRSGGPGRDGSGDPNPRAATSGLGPEALAERGHGRFRTGGALGRGHGRFRTWDAPGPGQHEALAGHHSVSQV